MDVRELTAATELFTASALLAEIWRPTDPMPYEMLQVTRHIGGYVSGAFDGNTMIGACAAFPTADGGLHSHVTGVAVQGRGVGFAIKVHQREWALARGVRTISWTFDPLARRNAHFNLAKLAAHAVRYLEDFYGEMPDELNMGDPSDRLLVTWPLDSPEVTAAVAGTPVTPEPGEDTAITLDEDSMGRPERHDPAGALTVAVGTPADITTMRACYPDAAREWRQAQRDALGGALAAGYRVTGFTLTGYYLLEGPR
ncbi:GNAT family N-acetyltransferase [Actinoallomurus purpureus]|uniref:GNAT family N-acetyltransferase n=1 Tax=Actinoallomurus purpureus TaxID=478114 RepID=UPI0020931625|nr:GNAT family N-acetyltransferase [Actinoallomurus purpureus]MCO6006024.1 GNAT family N-acetyltransferase [Actinoallomurus purpureus]